MEYTLQLLVQELIEEVKAKWSSKKIDFVEGTEFSLQLPVYKEFWGHCGYLYLLDGYALFNPRVTFKITMQHPKIDSPYIFEYPSMGARSKEFTGTSSIYWYTESEFKQFVGLRSNILVYRV